MIAFSICNGADWWKYGAVDKLGEVISLKVVVIKNDALHWCVKRVCSLIQKIIEV